MNEADKIRMITSGGLFLDIMRLFVFLTVLLLGIFPVLAGESIVLHSLPQKGGQQKESPHRSRVWLRTFGNWSQGDTFTSDTIRFSSYGVTLGLDRELGRNYLLGFAIGENNTSIDWSPLQGKTDLTALHADLFVRKTFDRFFLDIESNFGWNEHSFQKNATQWSVSGETATWWNHGLGKAEPYIRFSHVCWNGSGSETKETLAAGVRYSWRTSTTFTTTVPRFYGGVLQELGDQTLYSVSSFGNTPTVFPVQSLGLSATRMFLGGGFTTSLGTSLDISFRYTAEMSSRDTSHTALLGIHCNF